MPGSCRGRSVSRWSARSEARTYDLDGDLCAATGCPARGGRPGQIRRRGHARGVTACAAGLRVRARLTGVRRRARRASARQGAAGRPTIRSCPTAPRSGPGWRSVCQSRIHPDGSAPTASDPARRAGRLARRRRALEAVEKVVTALRATVCPVCAAIWVLALTSDRHLCRGSGVRSRRTGIVFRRPP